MWMCMCACVWVQLHTCHGTCVEGTGQLLGTSLFSSDSPASALHLTVGGLGLQMHAPTPDCFFWTRVLEIKFMPSAPCFDFLNPLLGPIFDPLSKLSCGHHHCYLQNFIFPCCTSVPVTTTVLSAPAPGAPIPPSGCRIWALWLLPLL